MKKENGKSGLEKEFRLASVTELIHFEPRKVLPSMPVYEVISLMQEGSADYVLIVDRTGKLQGIFTDTDILMKVLKAENLETSGSLSNPISRYMSTDVKTIKSSASIKEAVLMMYQKGFHHLPVMDEENQIFGMINIRDFIVFILDHFPETVYNILPGHKMSTEHREGA